MLLGHLVRRRADAARAVAVTVVVLATGGLLAAPALGRSRSRPVALATGTSDTAIARGRLPGRWRLEGRRLTVRLPQPLALNLAGPAGDLKRLRLTVQCGENTVPLNMFEGAPYPWAGVTGASATVAPSTRVVRVALGRDLAGKTNLCSILIVGAESSPYPPFAPRVLDEIRAPMTVRRGRVRGCRPGPLERVVLQTAQIRVTVVHLTDGASTIDGFRACLLPHGTPRQIDRGGDAGGAGGRGTSAERFAAAGTWLAWADGYFPHSDLGGARSWTTRLLDMTAARPPRSIDTGPGVVSAVAVGTSGAVAWVVEPNQIDLPAVGPYGFPSSTDPAAELRAQRPGGSTVVLDYTAPATCPVGCHVDTGADLTNLTVSADGHTVTWIHAGIPRQARLP